MGKEEMQQKYMQFQYLQKQIEQASEQVEKLNEQLSDLGTSQEALQELGKVPEKNEILATIAPGIFIKAALQDNKKLLVSVGADTTVEKTVAQVLSMLEERKKKMTNAVAQADALLQVFSKQAMEIYKELEKESSESEEK